MRASLYLLLKNQFYIVFKKPPFLFAVALLFSSPLSQIHAEELGAEVPPFIGFVQQLASSPVRPENVFLLVEESPGTVKQYPGYFFDYNSLASKTPSGSGDINLNNYSQDLRWLLAAPVELKNKSGLSYSFVLAGAYGKFATTPVASGSFSARDIYQSHHC